MFDMRRREFITLLGGAAAAWPLAVRAQQGQNDPEGQAVTGTVRNAAGATSAPRTATIERQLFTMTPGAEFATNAWCYRRLAPDAPLDPNSALISQTLFNGLKANATTIYWFPDYPIYIVDNTVPTCTIIVGTVNPNGTIDRAPNQVALQPSFNAVPIPDPATFVPQGGTDREFVIYRPSKHEMWEGIVMAKTGRLTTNSAGQQVPEWSINWGGYEADVRTNPATWKQGSPPAPYMGAVAAGIPLIAFAITIGDIRQQAVNHAVGLVIPQSINGNDFRFPAQRTDGYNPQNGTLPSEGMIFRLPADLDLNTYSATYWDGVSPKGLWRLFAEAMQNYGMVLYDQAPNGVAIGEKGDTPQYPSNPYYTDPIVNASAGPGPSGWPYHVIATEFPWDRMQLLAPTA